jgi:hypothetical protein
MAKKTQQAYRGETPRQWPAWVWLSAGVVLGLVLSAVVLVKDWPAWCWGSCCRPSYS